MSTWMYRKPIPGLVAFAIAFLSQWLGHNARSFIRGAFAESHHVVCLAVGTAGMALVWRGLRKPEVPATWMGFLGALLIWVGWFELTFDYYSELFQFPDFEAGPGLVSTGGANLLMATLPIMFALFVLYGFENRQTKCAMLRWIHRNTGMNPGMPTPDNGRSFARITALETLFVVWFCYLFWLYVGYMTNNTVLMVAYVGWLAWFVYIFAKLLKIPRVGHAVRYGIPVGVIGWGLGEMPSHMGLYDEIWLKPFDYPLTGLVMLAIFTAGIVYVARWTPRRKPLPAPQSAA